MDTTTLELVDRAIRQQEAQSKQWGLTPNPGNVDAKAPLLDVRSVTLRKLRDYANDDQFGRGHYWRGRKPKDDKLDEVIKLFTQDDVIGPGLARFVSATLSNDPEWSLERPGEPEADLSAPEKALSAWHEESGLHQELKTALRAMLWGRVALLRVYIPDVYTEKLTQKPPTTLEEALEYVHIIALDCLQAGPVCDSHGRQVAYFYRYSQLIDNQPVSFVEVHTPQTIEVLRYLNGKLEAYQTPKPNPLYDPARIRRPRYLMYALEWHEDAFVRQGIMDKQDRLNVAWTNLGRNDDLSGFRMIVTTNAQEVVDDENRPVHWKVGPDRQVNLRGEKIDLPDGGETLLTPGVQVIDPVDPSKINLPTIEALTLAILRDFDQLWVEMASGAVAAESRKQSRKAFDNRVAQLGAVIVEAVRWAVKTALRLALYHAPNLKDQAWDDLEVDPKLFLDVSRGDLELFKALTPAYAQNLVSLETLIETNPAVVDAGSELERLKASPLKGFDVIKALVEAGAAPRQLLLEAAGYDEAKAAELVKQRLQEDALVGAGV